MDEEDIYGGLSVVPTPAQSSGATPTAVKVNTAKDAKASNSVAAAAASSAKPPGGAKDNARVPTNKESNLSPKVLSPSSTGGKPVIRLTVPKTSATQASPAGQHRLPSEPRKELQQQGGQQVQQQREQSQQQDQKQENRQPATSPSPSKGTVSGRIFMGGLAQALTDR